MSNLTDEQLITEVTEMRRQGITWYDIARALRISRHTLNDKVRPHLAPELNVRFNQVSEVTVKDRVHALLDEEGDMESTKIASRLEINFNSACHYRSTWRTRYCEPEVEPVARCEFCGLPVEAEGEVCVLCMLHRAGIIVAYTIEDLGKVLERLK